MRCTGRAIQRSTRKPVSFGETISCVPTQGDGQAPGSAAKSHFGTSEVKSRRTEIAFVGNHEPTFNRPSSTLLEKWLEGALHEPWEKVRESESIDNKKDIVPCGRGAEELRHFPCFSFNLKWRKYGDLVGDKVANERMKVDESLTSGQTIGR